MLNTHIGPYQIIREIGQDSIGHSFEAVHEAPNKTVTLKYLRAETVTPEILSRLYSEVRILALLDHPQIARVFGIVRRDGHLYLITEFLQGETLETILKKQGRMQPAIALALFRQMMAGVAFAHGLGVMHGDLKPSNVLVTDVDPPVKLLNFALAHVFGSNPVGSRDKNSRYIAPEQIEGNPPDARSDIYSLGMILYELIVGKQSISCLRRKRGSRFNSAGSIYSRAPFFNSARSSEMAGRVLIAHVSHIPIGTISICKCDCASAGS